MKKFEMPEIEVINFEILDIVTAIDGSYVPPEDGDDGLGWG